MELQGNRITILDADTIFYRKRFTPSKCLDTLVEQRLSTLDLERDFSLSSSFQPIYTWFATLGHVFFFSGCHIH